MYALIQHPAINSRFFRIVKLDQNARLSAAGYVTGSYKVIFPKLTISAAHKIMQILNKKAV